MNAKEGRKEEGNMLAFYGKNIYIFVLSKIVVALFLLSFLILINFFHPPIHFMSMRMQHFQPKNPLLPLWSFCQPAM